MTCPICSKAEARQYKPFCSRRCADVDLARWFKESYVIESDESATEEASAEPRTRH